VSAESMATCFTDAPFNLDILTTIRAEPGNDDDRNLSTGCKRVVFAAFGHRSGPIRHGERTHHSHEGRANQCCEEDIEVCQSPIVRGREDVADSG
jgi:hypothetical protein